MPPNTVYVGRPTKWGNPFLINGTTTITDRKKDGTLVKVKQIKTNNIAECLRAYEREYIKETDLIEELEELRGKNLACWCKPGGPCHADILLELANRGGNDI